MNRTVQFTESITMRHLIQTDAAINPGNSGGPLVNMDGEMVGINTAKFPTAEGISFAIAIDPVMSLIQELTAQGRIDRGFLGISAVNITEALAMSFGLPVSTGVGVISVVPASPADRAGLRGNDIIVGMANRKVSNMSVLDSILIEYRKGTSIDVEFFRGDDKRKVTVTLGERPR